jgi:hypothetical protein
MKNKNSFPFHLPFIQLFTHMLRMYNFVLYCFTRNKYLIIESILQNNEWQILLLD